MATIKDLIGIGPDELEKLSEEDLRKRCEPYLTIATIKVEEEEEDQLVSLDGAPNQVQRTTAKRTTTRKNNREDLIRELGELAKLHGVDINLPTKIPK